MGMYPRMTFFVTYCAGSHCNGAARAPAKLARLGVFTKERRQSLTGFAASLGWSPEAIPLSFRVGICRRGWLGAPARIIRPLQRYAHLVRARCRMRAHARCAGERLRCT